MPTDSPQLRRPGRAGLALLRGGRLAWSSPGGSSSRRAPRALSASLRPEPTALVLLRGALCWDRSRTPSERGQGLFRAL